MDAVTEAGTAVNAVVMAPAVEVKVTAGEASAVAVITPAIVSPAPARPARPR